MSFPPAKPRTVNCPICGQPTSFTPDNPYRPFCSQRCKLIDLGQWAKEEYRVPDDERLTDEESPDAA